MNKRIATPWVGRVDSEDLENSRRWHQQVCNVRESSDEMSYAPTILGFCCDAGVRRNQGRVGAKCGPSAIRRSLANLPCDSAFRVYDLGDVVCHEDALEDAQIQLSQEVTDVLTRQGLPISLGGGHEMAWGSYLGAQKYLSILGGKKTLGIINFDAHFDLRNPANGASSGTPFRQGREYCVSNGLEFRYFVVGLNCSANTKALFDYARESGTQWIRDIDVSEVIRDEQYSAIENFIANIDCLYLSICLDVFSAAFSPGVSAPASVGIAPTDVIRMIHLIKKLCQLNSTNLLLCDIAEMNPQYDIDGRTAALAARLVHEILS